MVKTTQSKFIYIIALVSFLFLIPSIAGARPINPPGEIDPTPINYSYYISGEVKDETTGELLEGITVRLCTTAGNTLATTTTNSAGTYSLVKSSYDHGLVVDSFGDNYYKEVDDVNPGTSIVNFHLMNRVDKIAFLVVKPPTEMVYLTEHLKPDLESWFDKVYVFYDDSSDWQSLCSDFRTKCDYNDYVMLYISGHGDITGDNSWVDACGGNGVYSTDLDQFDVPTSSRYIPCKAFFALIDSCRAGRFELALADNPKATVITSTGIIDWFTNDARYEDGTWGKRCVYTHDFFYGQTINPQTTPSWQFGDGSTVRDRFVDLSADFENTLRGCRYDDDDMDRGRNFWLL